MKKYPIRQSVVFTLWADEYPPPRVYFCAFLRIFTDFSTFYFFDRQIHVLIVLLFKTNCNNYFGFQDKKEREKLFCKKIFPRTFFLSVFLFEARAKLLKSAFLRLHMSTSPSTDICAVLLLIFGDIVLHPFQGVRV